MGQICLKLGSLEYVCSAQKCMVAQFVIGFLGVSNYDCMELKITGKCFLRHAYGNLIHDCGAFFLPCLALFLSGPFLRGMNF